MRASNAERSRRYRLRHPERVADTRIRFEKSEKGKLNRWACTAAARCRKDEIRRGDGRLKKAAGGILTTKQLKELWRQQSGRCAITGRAFVIRNGTPHLNSPSVDRIDRSVGYIIGNVRLITYQANCARLFGTDDDLRDFCMDVLNPLISGNA